MQKIIVNFASLRDAELVSKAQHIVAEITGNASFPTPAPALTAITTAVDAYSNALAQAEAGGKLLIETKNQKRKELEDLLGKLGVYVQLNSNDDLVVMLSSGFDVSKPRTPAGALSSTTLAVEPNGKGSVKLIADAVKDAHSYLFEYRLVDEDTWTAHVSTKSKTIISNLISGKQYVFRVVAIGSDPTRNYSNEVTSFIL